MDGGEEDRLSALSDHLLLHILHLVPSKEAASTSVLSRRWGSLWRSSGAVNLAVRIHDGQDILARQEAFVRAAEAALAAAAAPVTRLTVPVEAGDPNNIGMFLRRTRQGWRKRGDVLGDVLSHPAVRHVEELLVDSCDASLDSDQDQEIDRCRAICKVAFLPASKTLRVLDLSRCGLALPARVAFPRLATLKLRLIAVKPKSLEALLDGAPALATVHLESVFFNNVEPPVVRLRLPNVSTLVLAWCGLEGPGSRSCKWAIDIDAPRLRSFVYKGHVRPFVLRPSAPPPDIALVDLRFLNNGPYEGSGYSYGRGDDDKEAGRRALFWQFVQSFSNPRTLKLTLDSDLKDIATIGKARRAKLLCAFNNIQRLELEGVHRPATKTTAVAISNLLQCCPLLRDLRLNLRTVRHGSLKGKGYILPFMDRKDRLDYNKSIGRFVRRSRVLADSKTTGFAMNDSSSTEDIPGLSGRSFACLQSSLRRVSLRFQVDDNSSSNYLGERLLKFFATNTTALEEICVDSGNRRFYQHLDCKACFQHKDLSESSRKFTMLPPLQRRMTITSLDPL